MNKNEKFVITINRELGSGGRTVGRKLAEKLSVEFYDKAVIKGLQEKYHLTVEEIEKLKGRKQGWWADFKRQLSGGPGMSANYYIPKVGDEPELLDTDQVFKAETEILSSIGTEESCGDYIYGDINQSWFLEYKPEGVIECAYINRFGEEYDNSYMMEYYYYNPLDWNADKSAYTGDSYSMVFYLDSATDVVTAIRIGYDYVADDMN